MSSSETSTREHLIGMLREQIITLFKSEVDMASVRGSGFPEPAVLHDIGTLTIPQIAERLEMIRDRLIYLHDENLAITARRSTPEAVLAYMCKPR